MSPPAEMEPKSMPLDRLHRILASTLEVSVDGSQGIADEVNRLARAGMNPKAAVPYVPAMALTQHSVRPIDLLRKIGEVTTPRTVNLARLSASWATRRYFWCIQAAGNTALSRRFRLSRDARQMERHQKTLLSDEFGVGFAALFMEQVFGASQVVDVQFALADPNAYFGLQAGRAKRRPDYVMWAPGGTVYIVECKGCQTSRSASINQLRRGMEQVPTVSIPGSTVPQLVIGTYMAKNRTTLFVVDPPADDDLEIETLKEGKEIERRGPREFRVADEVRFRTKLRRGSNLQYLRWISQHQLATRFESTAGYRPDAESEFPDAGLVQRSTDTGDFVGVEAQLAPEFGFTGPTIFRGLERSLYEKLKSGELEATSDHPPTPSNSPLLSTGIDGTCLMVTGV